jgi:hypothetical protein
MVKVVEKWRPQEKKLLNLKVQETLSFLECIIRNLNKPRPLPIFLLAINNAYGILYKDQIIYTSLTRTDLKQISRLAESKDLEIEMDITQPLAIGIFRNDKQLIQEKSIIIDEEMTNPLKMIRVKDLRKVLP